MDKVRENTGYLIAGFFLGVIISSQADFGWPFLIWLAGLALALLGLWLIFERKEKYYLIAVVILLGMTIGISRYDFFGRQLMSLPIDHNVILTGRIVAEPDERQSNTQIIFEDKVTSQRVLLITNRYPRFNYGDLIKIDGKLQRPDNFTTQTGKEFDYQNYLAVRGIDYQMFYPKIILSQPASWTITGSLIRLKNLFVASLKKVLPEPQNSLMDGLLLGSKSGLGQEVENNFRRAGVSHIIVLSGYNITVVADFIMRLLFFLPRLLSFSGGIIGIIFFTLMVGGGGAATRAAVMAVLALLSRGYGRVYNAGAALVVAACLMVLWNPKIFVFDLSFQLSFLAAAGIIYLTPLLENKLKFLPARFGLRELAATTGAAQLAVYPWIAYQMGNVSLIGLLANLLILPAVPVSMFLGFITGLSGLLSYFISLPFSYLSYFLLSYILLAAKIFSAIPGAAFTIKNFPLILVLLIYAFLFGILLKSKINVVKNSLANN